MISNKNVIDTEQYHDKRRMTPYRDSKYVFIINILLKYVLDKLYETKQRKKVVSL